MKYPPRKIMAVDVDGTLFYRGEVNHPVADFCRRAKADGYSLTLWSMRGEDYARRAAEAAGMADVFDHIMGKPHYIVDDQGWSWTQYTSVVTCLE